MKILLNITFALAVTFALAQDNRPQGSTYQGTISSMEYVPSLASRMNELTPPDNTPREARDKRSFGQYLRIDQQVEHPDPILERTRELQQRVPLDPPSLVIDNAYSSNSQPTDPSLAVGPNHVFVVYNTAFVIYDKAGNIVEGPLGPGAIFPSSGCCDLTASYDNAADRWVLSFLGNGAQIAVSDGPDPTTAGWYIYTISSISDYQKLSIWSDGYYLTDNTTSPNKVWVLERDALLNGTSAGVEGYDLPGIRTFGFYSPQVFNVTDANLPANGGATVVYMQDDAWSGVSNDHLKMWTVTPSWTSSPNSGSVSAATEFPIEPFIGVFDNGSFANLEQPGRGRKVNIDALQATIMNQAQFRKFATHNSAVFNFVVDTDASSGEVAGVRWFEFRQNGDNQPWYKYQEGTYVAPDNRHAWNASLAMDAQGNIGMGYSSMSSKSSSTRTYVSSYFTGQTVGAASGVMDGQEQLISNGNNKIPGARYGDYSKIDVDPADGYSFWYITEYLRGSRGGVIGKFQIQSNSGPDTDPPSTPTNISVSDVTENSARLNWTASTDNVGVAGYNVYLDGNLVGTTVNTAYDYSGLSSETQYMAAVEAYDAAGNTSGSAMISFTTLTIDTEAPTAPTNVTASDITENSARIDWAVSTDNVGVEQYNITVNGASVGSTASTTFNLNGLAPLTVYNVGVRAQDAAGNESAAGTVSFETLEGNTGGGQIAAYYFETGLQGWTLGGRDSQLQNTGNSCEGNQSIRLRNGSSRANATSPALDLTGNNQITFEMQVYASGMESNDSFSVQILQGNSYVTFYDSGAVTNGSCFPVSEVLSASQYTFNNNNRFRVQNNGNKNNDFIWFDAVIINGDPAPFGGASLNRASMVTQAKILTANNQIELYPNPAQSTLSVQFGATRFDRVIMFTATGALIEEREIDETQMNFDVSTLPSGVYFMRFLQGKLAVTKRFVKQ